MFHTLINNGALAEPCAEEAGSQFLIFLALDNVFETRDFFSAVLTTETILFEEVEPDGNQRRKLSVQRLLLETGDFFTEHVATLTNWLEEAGLGGNQLL